MSGRKRRCRRKRLSGPCSLRTGHPGSCKPETRAGLLGRSPKSTAYVDAAKLMNDVAVAEARKVRGQISALVQSAERRKARLPSLAALKADAAAAVERGLQHFVGQPNNGAVRRAMASTIDETIHQAADRMRRATSVVERPLTPLSLTACDGGAPHIWVLVGTEKVAEGRWRVHGQCDRCRRTCTVTREGWEAAERARGELQGGRCPEGGEE